MHLIPYSAKTTPKVCLITALTLKVYAFEGYCLTYSTLMHFGSLERSSPMCPVDNMEREKQKNFQGDGAIKTAWGSLVWAFLLYSHGVPCMLPSMLGEPGKLIRERYRTASQVVQNQLIHNPHMNLHHFLISMLRFHNGSNKLYAL
ncbi:hypothetical protein CK203_021059 [Vitis vinifera]|uniref:Uncharacterized protein n=1 Tax=Vitis vinifera TaxID=29760 RepID=A0A438JWS5_VITVI|nr:hypothetical protein CK203_021059 [Vitis vinifera]